MRVANWRTIRRNEKALGNNFEPEGAFVLFKEPYNLKHLAKSMRLIGEDLHNNHSVYVSGTFHGDMPNWSNGWEVVNSHIRKCRCE